MEKRVPVPFSKQLGRTRGRSQLESLILVGAVALAGASAYGQLGDSSEQAIGGVAASATSDGPIHLSSAQEAASWLRAGQLAQRARDLVTRAPDDAALRAIVDNDLSVGGRRFKYDQREVPERLERLEISTDWFDALQSKIVPGMLKGQYDLERTVWVLTRQHPKAKPQAQLLASVVFEILNDIDAKVKAVDGTAFRSALDAEGGEWAAVHAAEYAMREGFEPARFEEIYAKAAQTETISPKTLQMIRALPQILGEGLDASAREDVFGKVPLKLHPVGDAGRWFDTLRGDVVPGIVNGDYQDAGQVAARLQADFPGQRARTQSHLLATVVFNHIQRVDNKGLLVRDFGKPLEGVRPELAPLYAAVEATRGSFRNEAAFEAAVRRMLQTNRNTGASAVPEASIREVEALSKVFHDRGFDAAQAREVFGDAFVSRFLSR